MGDSGEDFGGYMEHLMAAEEEAAKHAQMLHEHEIWRQTTWGGWAVREIQAVGRHFQPFVLAVSDMMQDEENVGKRLLAFLLRLIIIFIAILFLYILGRIINQLIGGDIIREEEVVIIHEHDTEEEAEQARAAMSRGKRSKRGAKEE